MSTIRSKGTGMTTYTDEMMRERLAKAASYTLVMLRVTDKYEWKARIRSFGSMGGATWNCKPTV
jgi:hypothetical protein